MSRFHDFIYKKKELYCEGVRVRDIAEKVGTPVYIYSHKIFVEHVRKIQKAFRSVPLMICYSMKANSSLAILKSLVDTGAGLDIVSGGELYRAKRVKCPPEKIVFAGTGKSESEISAPGTESSNARIRAIPLTFWITGNFSFNLSSSSPR